MFSNKTQGDLSWLTTRPPVESFNIPQVAGGGGIKGEMTKVCARGSGFDPPVERDDRQFVRENGLGSNGQTRLSAGYADRTRRGNEEKGKDDMLAPQNSYKSPC